MKTKRMPASRNVIDDRQRSNRAVKADPPGIQRSGKGSQSDQRNQGAMIDAIRRYEEHAANKGDRQDKTYSAGGKTDMNPVAPKSDRSMMHEINKTISKDLNDFVKGRRLPHRNYGK